MAAGSSFVEEQRARAAAWKRATGTLPSEATPPAPYINKDGVETGMHDFCLPPDYAVFNLLPEVRDPILELFAELGIPWHASVGGGPSNHLLSSQVQCANALGQMVTDPERIGRAFAGSCDIGEVLQIEPGRYLTFEYIGEVDFFGEVPSGERTRGSGCTSVDAAFLHRSTAGIVELVLVEWKFTESYRRRTPNPGKDAVRRRRYEQALHEPDGPVRADVLDIVNMLDEPLYQLVRQQLLAHRLEQACAHGTEQVRILHVLPPGNVGYQRSLHRPSQQAVGATVDEVWRRLLRHTDRFAHVDPAVFTDPKITSDEYVSRYGAPIMISPAEALHQRILEDPDVDPTSLQTGTDRTLSVGRDVWRLRWRGQPTTAVAGNAGLLTTCGALLDALAVRERATAGSPPAWLGEPLDLSTVNVLVDRPLPAQGGEVDQALRSMRDAVVGVHPRIWYADDARGWTEDVAPAPVWELGHPRVRSWVDTLLLPRLRSAPPPLAHALVAAVDDPSIQLYPSTTAGGVVEVWSLRADGLQIGTVTPTHATLTVGKPGKHGDGPQRKMFAEVFGAATVAVEAGQPTAPTRSVEDAAAGIRTLLRRFRGADVRGAPITHRATGGIPYVDEHTLEARLLKGLARLTDVAAAPVHADAQVARGSQFPTLWAESGSEARYLDALLAEGTTPHAVELKVATGGQGRYYRRSLVQAVLYRHFIRHASDLDEWFTAANLDRAHTVGSIGVPIPTRWTATFDRDLQLLRAVAARVGCHVHVIDDRSTPTRASAMPAGHSPPEDQERHTWRLAAAITARWPRSLGRVTASAEMDGFYDFVVLQPLADRTTTWPSPRPRLKINRAGSIRVYAQTGAERWHWHHLWDHLHGGGDLTAAVADIGAVAGLGPAEEPPAATFPQLAYKVLDTAGAELHWRCAWDPNYGAARWLDAFPTRFGRYARHAADGHIPTVGRLWAAIGTDDTPQLVIDHENLRTWTAADGGQEILHADPFERARLSAAAIG